MPKAPDGTIVDESSSNKDVGAAVSGTEKEADGCRGPNPNPAGGAGTRPGKEHRPRSPGPIDELITALREATLGPACPRRHGLDPLPDDDRRRPKIKIQPPSF